MAAAPPQNQKMFKIGAVYVVRSLHTNFEPNQTILAMFCTQPAKSPHLSTPPLVIVTLFIYREFGQSFEKNQTVKQSVDRAHLQS